MPDVTETTLDFDGQPVFVRRAGADEVPVLYLHGVPTNSDDWLPFLREGGGVAPDLPGFGRTGKRGDGDYTPLGLARFVGRLVDALALDRVRLCVHDWGAAGLLWAMEDPSRVERLCVVNAIPFLPGYRWHAAARVWRTRGLGELAMGFVGRRSLRVAGRALSPRHGALPPQVVRAAAGHFDPGTQRATLRLYRSAPARRLAELGAGLPALASTPALVAWGARDPFIPVRFAAAYAEVLGASVVEVPDAGHWPWWEQGAVVGQLLEFLHGGAPGGRSVR